MRDLPLPYKKAGFSEEHIEMRIVFITLLPLVLYASVVLAQAAPTAKKPAPAGKSPPEQTAEEARADGIAECMRLWDTATHMSKQEWSRTCQRIQSRLENLKIENLRTMRMIDPKKKSGS